MMSFGDDLIVVIGAGISGLACAYLLSRGYYRVLVLEGSSTPGGHANTITIDPNGGSPFDIDTGFIVFNSHNYPELESLFQHLDVQVENSNMSLAVSVQLDSSSTDENLFEWGSDAVKESLSEKRFWIMMWDMSRFNREVNRRVVNNVDLDITLCEFLDENGYSEIFKRAYLSPMLAAIWSSPISGIMDFPLSHVFRHLHNHGLDKIFGRPQWKTVSRRSKTYVNKLVHAIENNRGEVRCDSKVVAVERLPGRPRVKLESGESIECDKVVFATPAQVALRLLGEHATDDEKRILRVCRSTQNEIIIHTDENLMPRNRKTWSAWNFIGRQLSHETVNSTHRQEASDRRPVCVTYWLNLLQNLDPISPNIFETLNPIVPVDESKILARVPKSHPLFPASAVQAQQDLKSIQGLNNTFYAGAWTRYGFHEDGVCSGFDVGSLIAGRELRPWKLKRSLVFKDNTKSYCLPCYELPGLFFLSTVVGKVNECLNEIIAKDEHNACYGAKVCGHLGILEDVGKRARASLIVRSWKFYARIMNAVISESMYVSDAVISSFAKGELEVGSLEDLHSFVLTLTSGQFAASFPKDKPKKGGCVTSSLLDPFSLHDRIFSRILGFVEPTARHDEDHDHLLEIPKAVFALRRALDPCWWDNSASRDKGVEILELFGGLELTTLKTLKCDKSSQAVVVVEAEEDFLLASSKMVSERLEEQVKIYRYEEFVGSRRVKSKFDCIISPLAGNIYARYWKSLIDLMRFIKSFLKPNGIAEIGFSCCPNGSRSLLLPLEIEENYNFVTARSILQAAEFVGLGLAASKRMDEKEASYDVKGALADLNLESLSIRDAKLIISMLIRWETALEVGRISRVVTVLWNTTAQ